MAFPAPYIHVHQYYRSSDRNVLVCVRDLIYTPHNQKRILDIYYRIPPRGEWRHATSLSHPQRDRAHSFGNAVALSHDGKVILVSDATPTSEGTVYEYSANEYYEWSPSGRYRQKVYGYGLSVALSSDDTQVFIGAQSVESPGVVYCYKRGGLLLQEIRQQRIPPCLDSFGASLVYDPVSQFLIVGAPRSEPFQYYEDSKCQGAGHVHFYYHEDTQWVYSTAPEHRWYGRTGYGKELYLATTRYDVTKEVLYVHDGNRLASYDPNDWRIPPVSPPTTLG